MNFLAAAVAALHLAAAAGDARQPVTPQAALERLFTADHIQAEWFGKSFLQKIPPAQVEIIIGTYKNELGAYQKVEPAGRDFIVRMAKGTIPISLSMDAQGRIVGLLFRAPRAKIGSFDEALADLRKLPGRTSLLVAENGRVRTSLNASEPLAVGSAFKLAVLAALVDQIASGRRRWADVVALRPAWKSLPSGALQTWPDGSLLTLQTLASLMISQSDNTAADALLDIVGRNAVEAESPRNTPFPSTRELFTLKAPDNKDLLDRWRSGGVEQRREVLREADHRPLPAVADYALSNAEPDVEWHISATELCGLMAKVAALPLMGINPGVADRNAWAKISFKGGSESGVLNLTTQLEDRRGRTYCVAATWNDTQILEDTRFYGIYGGVLRALNRGIL